MAAPGDGHGDAGGKTDPLVLGRSALPVAVIVHSHRPTGLQDLAQKPLPALKHDPDEVWIQVVRQGEFQIVGSRPVKVNGTLLSLQQARGPGHDGL